MQLNLHEDSIAWFNIIPPEPTKEKDVFEKEIETLEEAVKMTRRTEFLRTAKLTKESAKELEVLKRKIQRWWHANESNGEILAKYRTENDSDWEMKRHHIVLRAERKKREQLAKQKEKSE